MPDRLTPLTVRHTVVSDNDNVCAVTRPAWSRPDGKRGASVSTPSPAAHATANTMTSSAVNARAAARAEPRMLVDGERREARSGARFDNLSPATGRVLGSTAAADAHDMHAAIEAARRAF